MDDLTKAQQLGQALVLVREVRNVLEDEGYSGTANQLEEASTLIMRAQHACASAWGTEVSQ
jgi:hypothetical protein